MAAHSNVAIKVSNFPAYAADRSLAGLSAVVTTCLDAFGPARTMFATDYPVGGRHSTLREVCEWFRDIVADRPAAEQRALFHDNAARYYRFDERT
jgi:predicted TIM-barrel fold metal-dependent hydrolase